jgi:hypothetical protein
VKTDLLAMRDDCSSYAQRLVWFTGNVASKIYQVFGVARRLEEGMQVPSLDPKITTASLQYLLIVPLDTIAWTKRQVSISKYLEKKQE